MVYLACIIAYLLLLATIAVWKSREVKDQSDFSVAGRTLSPWMMVCTMLAVWIGTGSIVGNAEQTYETGMAALLLPVGTFAGMVLLSLIAIKARNIEASSVPEIIERRFGSTARNLAMLSLVTAYMVIVSYQFNAGGAVLEVIVGEKDPQSIAVGDALTTSQLSKGRLRFTPSDSASEMGQFVVHERTRAESTLAMALSNTTRIRFDPESLLSDAYVVQQLPSSGTIELIEPILTAQRATVIAAAFIICYAALAGLLSLAWMDLVTGSVIMLTMVISFPVYWFQAGGWTGIQNAFVAHQRAEHVQLWGVYPATQLINYTLPVFLLLLGDANQYQRIFASRTAKGARTAVIAMVFVAYAVELLIIACAWITSSMTPDPENGKYILIYAARHYLALPLGCLFMVTVVAIIVSTADSFLHVPATTVANDLYFKYINPRASQRRLVWVSRLLVVVFGIVAYIVTLLFSETTGFFDKALYAFTIYGASITPSLVAALVWTRATKWGAITSICAGALVTLIWGEVDVIKESLPTAWSKLDAVLPAITVSVAMLVGVSLLTRRAAGGVDASQPSPEQNDV